MIDIKAYLESGIIECYCLGTATPREVQHMFELCHAYPEVKAYFEQTQIALEVYISSFKKIIPPDLKETFRLNILEAIKLDVIKLSTEGMLSDFIDISTNINLEKLEDLIKDLHPPAEYESTFVKTLYAQEGKDLHLVWVKDLVPMEHHDHLDESFLVLEGTADCNIDGVITHMKRGDFMRIPPDSHHEVVITSATPAKAIQSRITLF